MLVKICPDGDKLSSFMIELPDLSNVSMSGQKETLQTCTVVLQQISQIKLLQNIIIVN